MLLCSPKRRYPLGQSEGLGFGQEKDNGASGQNFIWVRNNRHRWAVAVSRVAVAGLTNHLRKGRNLAAGTLAVPVSLPVPVWVGGLLSGRK